MKVLYAAKIIDLAQLQQTLLLIKCFKAHQVDTDVILSGNSLSKPTSKLVIEEIEALKAGSCLVKHKPIRFTKTFRQKMADIFTNRAHFKLANYDLVITDNESIVAWSAKLSGIPVMALGHHEAVNHYQLPFEGANLSRIWQQWLIPADYRLGFHWIPFAQNILPPIVPRYHTTCIKNKVVVYLPSEKIEAIESLFTSFPNTEFYCYHPAAEMKSVGNIHYRSDDHEQLLNDMKSCKGVITHAQFEVINAALNMGKSLLIKPLEQELVQVIDASLLIKLGWAKQMHYLNPNAVEDFLETDAKKTVDFSADPCVLVEWIKAEQWHDVTELHDSAWKTLKVG
ncbi:glycosyltransferase family protein [Pseudoalteromonas phenolica]|uniref:glycosyltransferase family protein n=1 Tax=Pseudoalteromonas phenolica TaxID=161398 RepID=UPI001375F251|nr:glycosyltransferase family protein [Pseudoalteromonas phenolica]MBE0355342.1 hypothetical protein [Pseudoalteromonas phenolica O-BC30]